MVRRVRRKPFLRAPAKRFPPAEPARQSKKETVTPYVSFLTEFEHPLGSRFGLLPHCDDGVIQEIVRCDGRTSDEELSVRVGLDVSYEMPLQFGKGNHFGRLLKNT